MNTNIKATNIELTEAISDYVNKRVASLEKFSRGAEMSSYVEVGKTTNHHKQGDVFKAEFDIKIAGTQFFAMSEQSDLYAAIDDAKEEIVRKITHSKDRKKTLFKRGAISVKKMLKGISKRDPSTSKY
jgi:putative sigma-54 modulation protein